VINITDSLPANVRGGDAGHPVLHNRVETALNSLREQWLRFGVVPDLAADGITDDAPAINAHLTRYGVAYLNPLLEGDNPARNIRLASPVVLGYPMRGLFGAGWGAFGRGVILKPDPGVDAIVLEPLRSGQPFESMTVSDLAIIGGARGIYMPALPGDGGAVSNLHLSNLRISHFTEAGVKLLTSAYDSVYERIVCSGAGLGGVGWYQTGTPNNSLSYYHAFNIHSCDVGMYLGSSGDQIVIERINNFGNRIGIHLDGVQKFTISHPHFEYNSEVSILTTGSPHLHSLIIGGTYVADPAIADIWFNNDDLAGLKAQLLAYNGHGIKFGNGDLKFVGAQNANIYVNVNEYRVNGLGEAI
jgi:hypothetical protein